MHKARRTYEALRATVNVGVLEAGIADRGRVNQRGEFLQQATTSAMRATIKAASPMRSPRAVPIVESMAALVIMDAVLAQQARQGARSLLPLIKGVQPVHGAEAE